MRPGHVSPRRGRVLRPGIAETIVLAVLAAGALFAVVHPGSDGPRPTSTAASGPATTSTSTETGPPDVLEVVVDDLDAKGGCAALATTLPRSARYLIDRGTCYAHASGTDPVCCPARGEIQTGQLPHNDRVNRQQDADLLDYRHTAQYAIGRIGVRTFGDGKDLNGVAARRYVYGPDTPSATHAVLDAFPTGFETGGFWDSYDSVLPRGYRIHTDNLGFGLPHRTYGARLTGAGTRAFIRASHADGVPWYAYEAFYDPHEQDDRSGPRDDRYPQATPANAHRNVPTFVPDLERDRADKIRILRHHRIDVGFERGLHDARLRSMYDVDDQLARTFTLLRRTGQLHHTIVMFVSDNGFLLGEHGWTGKSLPYTDSVDVPMAVYDGTGRWFGSGVVDRREVSLADLAPTLYQIYGITPDYVVDGRSLLGHDRRAGQYFEFTTEHDTLVDHESGRLAGRVPSWRAYRVGDDEYVEYYRRDGSLLRREFYDEPSQNRDLLYGPYVARERRAGTLPTRRIAAMAAALHRYAHCAGTSTSAPDPCP